MTRRRILIGVAAFFTLAIVSLALALSYDSPCGAPPAPVADATRMKAIVYRCYGSPDVLELAEVAKPALEDDRVLVKVHAAAVNPVDWHYMRGEPYIMRAEAGFGRPKDARFGIDFAGTVEAVGKNVRRFRPGDEVFGGRSGALAEYVSVREQGSIAAKPANVTFKQAASVPVAAITALQALRDEGQLRPGQKVLVNGASGGVGTFAVQIAKSLGAEVTGVCSTRNADLVRSLGADHVIDYTREDYTQGAQRYDLVVDNVGNHSFLDIRRVLAPEGRYVIVGGPSDDPWIGAMRAPLKAFLLSPFVSQQAVFLLADLNQKDLTFLAELMQSGKMTPVIDRSYPLSETPAAITYLEEGHARGKVVIRVAHGSTGP